MEKALTASADEANIEVLSFGGSAQKTLLRGGIFGCSSVHRGEGSHWLITATAVNLRIFNKTRLLK